MERVSDRADLMNDTAYDESATSALFRGAVSGGIGAGVIALFFLLTDSVLQVPLYSPSQIGTLIFTGALPAPGAEVDLGHVASYTWAHGLMFMSFGIVMVQAMKLVDLKPTSLLCPIVLTVGLEIGFLTLSSLIGFELVSRLGIGLVTAGNGLAAIGMTMALRSLEEARLELARQHADSAGEHDDRH